MSDPLPPPAPLPDGLTEKQAIEGSLSLARLTMEFATSPMIWPFFVRFLDGLGPLAPVDDNYHQAAARYGTENMAIWFVTNVKPENIFLTPKADA